MTTLDTGNEARNPKKPEPPPVFVEPGPNPEPVVHFLADVLTLVNGAAMHQRRTVCGAWASHPTNEITVVDDDSACQTCWAHRHDLGVRGPYIAVRGTETPATFGLPGAERARAMLP